MSAITHGLNNGLCTASLRHAGGRPDAAHCLHNKSFPSIFRSLISEGYAQSNAQSLADSGEPAISAPGSPWSVVFVRTWGRARWHRWVPPPMTVTVAGASHQTAAQRGGDAREKDRPLPNVQRDRRAPQGLCRGLMPSSGLVLVPGCMFAQVRGVCSFIAHLCRLCAAAARHAQDSLAGLVVQYELLLSAQCDHGVTAGLKTCSAR